MYFIPFSESISKDVELMLFDFTAGIEYKNILWHTWRSFSL